MFSRGLSAAIPTVTAPHKNIVSAGIIYPRNMMIPNGNIRAGRICPWVSLRSTHGYKKDHPQGDATHPHGAPTHTFRGRCHRGRASTRPYIAYCKSIKYGADYIDNMHRGYIACCTSTKYAGITSTKNAPGLHRVAVGATGRSPATSAWRTHARNISPTGDNPCLAVG